MYVSNLVEEVDSTNGSLSTIDKSSALYAYEVNISKGGRILKSSPPSAAQRAGFEVISRPLEFNANSLALIEKKTFYILNNKTGRGFFSKGSSLEAFFGLANIFVNQIIVNGEMYFACCNYLLRTVSSDCVFVD